MSISLQLETTAVCNAACVFCVYPTEENSRRKGRMSLPLYRKLVDEAAGIEPIEQLCLTGLGEPTLDPDLEERIRYAHKVAPNIVIDFFTNGEFLTPERFLAFKAAGVGCVSVSLNAVRPEQHERIMKMRAGAFDTICKNLDYAIANRGDVVIQVRTVFNPNDFSVDDVRAFYARWGIRKDGGFGQAVFRGNWSGDISTPFPFDPKEACDRALSQIYVTWDGKATTCCFDPVGKQVFGDLNTQTIREVYNSDAYVAFRQAHNEGRADEYAVCKGCSRI